MTLSVENIQEFTAADAIVQELERVGVEVVFGVVSIHNMPIYDAILRRGKIRIVPARGESGAVNMADGYARATGKLGVVLTSTGTGAGNAAGSIIEAWSAGAPVLHITGEVASPYLGTGRGYIHEMKDQYKLLEGTSKEAYLVRNPEQIVAIMRQAISAALTAPTGPVSIEIPIDYQNTIIPNTHVQEPISYQPSFDPNQIIVAVEKIKAAKRPVIWAGGGVISSGAATEIKQLAELIGAAVITSQSGKGSIPENHPQCIGHFAANPAVKEFLATTDLLISVGVRFRGNETSNWKVQVPSEHICIDVDPQAFNRNYWVTHGLVGDAKLILAIIIEQLKKEELNTNSAYLKEVKQLRESVREKLRETLGPYEQILDSMRQILPQNTIHVRDITVHANLWGSRLIEIYEPRTSIHASGGGIGQGLPMAIGAQIGRPDHRVVLMVGDGGFLLNIGELATAAQEKLPIIIILFDDNGYGVIRNIQEAAYGRQIGVDLTSPDFETLGKSFGFDTKRVRSTAEFAAELERMVATNLPSMIVIDMESIGPMKKPFGGPPGVADQFRPRKMNK